MTRPVCCSCYEELRYISNRRMMCWNKICEKVYAMDYECVACSAQKRLKVLMEVVAPGEVRCLLCDNTREAPGLNLETMMGSKTISHLGNQSRERRGQERPSRSFSFRTPRVSERDEPPTQPFRATRNPNTVSQAPQFSIFPERAEPYREETSDGLTIIIEFPGHTIEQISLQREGLILIIESAIIACPYRDEIILPHWATKPIQVQLAKGFLIIEFTK